MNFNRIVILASCTVLRANLGGVDGNLFLNMKDFSDSRSLQCTLGRKQLLQRTFHAFQRFQNSTRAQVVFVYLRKFEACI